MGSLLLVMELALMATVPRMISLYFLTLQVRQRVESSVYLALEKVPLNRYVASISSKKKNLVYVYWRTV